MFSLQKCRLLLFLKISSFKKKSHAQLHIHALHIFCLSIYLILQETRTTKIFFFLYIQKVPLKAMLDLTKIGSFVSSVTRALMKLEIKKNQKFSHLVDEQLHLLAKICIIQSWILTIGILMEKATKNRVTDNPRPLQILTVLVYYLKCCNLSDKN